MAHVAREMERARFQPAVAHRRRDHQQSAHRRENRAALQRSRRPRPRRLPRRRRGQQSDQPDRKADSCEQIRDEYEQLRSQHAGPQAEAGLRSKKPAPTPRRSIGKPKNCQAGIHRRARSLDPTSPNTSRFDRYIDWSPFFHTWELRGRYPAILKHEKHGEEATQTFRRSARSCCRKSSDKIGSSSRAASTAFSRRIAVGDDVELYTDESRKQVLTKFHFLRQQIEKPAGQSVRLADFVAPKGTGIPDYLGAFAVTSRPSALRNSSKNSKKITTITTPSWPRRSPIVWPKPLPNICTNAPRDDWGYGKTENLTTDELIEEKYRGIRPAAGYPACPDHTEKWTSVELARRGKKHRHQADRKLRHVARQQRERLYFAHPESKYFAVGKLGRDQIARLSPPQRHDRCRKSNAGSGRI